MKKTISALFVFLTLAPLGVSAQVVLPTGINTNDPTLLRASSGNPTFTQQQSNDSGQGASDPRASNFQLVPCNGAPAYQKDANGQVKYDSSGKPIPDTTKVNCDFNQLIVMVNRIIKFLLYLAIPLVLGMILYMGFKYLTANGDPKKLADAKKMFIPVVIGLFWILAAYIIVYTVLDTFLAPTVGGIPKQDIIYLNVKK